MRARSSRTWRRGGDGVIVAVRWPVVGGFALLVGCQRDPGDGLVPGDLVEIDGASFDMGCDACDFDEAPVHAVTLSAYVIDAFEVNFGLYAECVAAGACEEPAMKGDDERPATGVGYDDATAYCQWRGLALPTEARWEYAARGGDGRTYPWGDDEPDCDRAATRACGGMEAVGSHPEGASPFGVQDLSGNAWEWVGDWYSTDYYAEGDSTDPAGSDLPGLRTVRGIELVSDQGVLRASNREYAIPDGRSPNVGFRCAGSL